MAISRRALLKRIGVAGTAAVVPVAAEGPVVHDHADVQAPAAAAASSPAHVEPMPGPHRARWFFASGMIVVLVVALAGARRRRGASSKPPGE